MTSTTVSPKQTWWWWQRPRQRLIKWTKALLQGRRYTIKVEPYQHRGRPGTGYHNPKLRVIVVNPQFFAGEPVETQFRATQGILAHEVGHAFFTDAWPTEDDQQALRWLVNALEDERMERAICIYYPGITALIRLIGDLIYQGTEQMDDSTPAEMALACCLSWRWAQSRAGESEMFERLGIEDQDTIDPWHEIKPLVEESWTADNTGRVIEIARDILAILELPEGYSLSDLPIFQIVMGAGDGIPEERIGEALPFPVSAFDGASPGQGTDFDDESIPTPRGDDITQPAPYAALENAAAPLARQLVDALKIPQPHVRPMPHEWRGRYSFRQEVRTPTMPHLRRAGIGREKDDVVFYVLVDRSGSMGVINEPVRLALMTLYLAATELGIPLGMAYFGEHSDAVINDLVLEISPLRARAAEETKSLIAGFRGVTGAEFLDWGLALAEKALRHRPERRKVLLVIHDGEPVYSGRLGNDYQLSLERLRRLERQSITPIGLYLGERGNMAQLEALFPRLVITSGQKLPEKLGNMLQSLS
ncbi:MAG: hypothetical protein ISS57_18080 [Anaerolineales bacterium]|nr:hypothetical protein [Anaerolineales bacterium]